MTITQLRYFDAVYRLGNVTNAARLLFVSQPSVSNAIRELESELGVQLFYRVKMRLIPTEEGDFFHKESMKILQEMDKLSDHMKMVSAKHNLIRLGVPPMIGTLVFPDIFLNFRKSNPEMRIQSTELGAFTCWEQMKNETLDMAITAINGIDEDKFSVFHLVDTELQFCIGKNHPLAKQDCVSIHEIKDIPVILLLEGALTRQQAIDLYTHNGYEPNILLHSNQIHTIEHLVSQGEIGAFLFKDIIQQNPDVKGLSLTPPLEPVHIGVVWRKDKHLYNDAICFLNFIRKLYRDKL